MQIVGPNFWFETVPVGLGVTLIHEPWIKPFYRCNMWHVRGRDADLLLDTGLRAVSLREQVSILADREPICVASHTHFDHIGGHHEFSNRCVHCEEQEILKNPDNRRTFASEYANEDMFTALPTDWDTKTYRTRPAAASRVLHDGDVVDLGDRTFEVLHVPGHSKGSIALWEAKTGILLSGDAIYDGPIQPDAYNGATVAIEHSLRRLGELPVAIVHGGHFGSFGRAKLREIVGHYIRHNHSPGCHLR